MRATIYSHTEPIGITDLNVGDEVMGHVFGNFIPSEYYFKEIQKWIWEFWGADCPDYKKWHSLRFNVQLDNGYFLYPAGGYTFDDRPDFPDEPKRIDIAGIDKHIIEDFFLQNESAPFVEQPWEQITIQQKTGFEDELEKELGFANKSIFDLFKLKQKKHPLADFEFSALCKNQSNDDVLFVVRKQNFEKQFAVSHLTWKTKKEIDGFPATVFYKDFDEFKRLRMYPDKEKWEF